MSDTDTSTALAAGAAAATADRAAEDVQELAQETESTLAQQQSQIEWQAEVQRMIESELGDIRANIYEIIDRLDLLESEYTEEPGENVEDVTTLEGSGSESPEDQPANDEPEPDPQPQGKHKKRAMGLW
jgi:preprotein translocase subunit SecA